MSEISAMFFLSRRAWQAQVRAWKCWQLFRKMTTSSTKKLLNGGEDKGWISSLLPRHLHLLAAQALVEETDALFGGEEGVLDLRHLQHLLHHPLPLLFLSNPGGQGHGHLGGHHHQADTRGLREDEPVAGHHRLPYIELLWWTLLRLWLWPLIL